MSGNDISYSSLAGSQQQQPSLDRSHNIGDKSSNGSSSTTYQTGANVHHGDKKPKGQGLTTRGINALRGLMSRPGRSQSREDREMDAPNNRAAATAVSSSTGTAGSTLLPSSLPTSGSRGSISHSSDSGGVTAGASGTANLSSGLGSSLLPPSGATSKPSKPSGGYLFKKGYRVKIWHRRFFLFRGDTLEYRKEHSSSTVQGTISLRRFELITPNEDSLDFDIITPGRTFNLRAESLDSKKRWISALEKTRRELEDNETANAKAVASGDMLSPSASSMASSGAVGAKKIADNAAVHCANCKEAFGFKRRRHHCVTCGFAFCSDEKCYESKEKKCRSCAKMTAAKVADLDFNVCNSNIIIRVCDAKDIATVDASTVTHCYAMIFFENKKYRTATAEGSQTPKFNQQFHIPVSGMDQALQVALFHEDKYRADELLGMVHIPLSALPVDELTDKHYPLMPRPGDAEKKTPITGSVHLQIVYTQSLYSMIAPISADMKVRRRNALSTQMIAWHVGRVKNAAQSLQLGWWSNAYAEVLSWRRPWLSLFVFTFYCSFCIYFPVSLLPSLIPFILVFVMTTAYIDLHWNTPSDTNEVINDDNEVDSDDNDDDDDEPKEKVEEKKVAKVGVFDKMRKYKASMEVIQNTIGDICDSIEEIQSVFWWRDPRSSKLTYQIMVLLTVLLYFVSLRWVLLVAGVYKFTKALRVPRGRIPVGEIRNFVQRAPIASDSTSVAVNVPAGLKKK